MRRRLNYTGRKTIDRELVTVQDVSGDAGPPSVLLTVRLGSLSFPEGARLFLEAHRKASFARVAAGTVGTPKVGPFEFRGFESLAGVRFRVKVVGEPSSASDVPPLLGAATGIEAHDSRDGETKLQSLLPIRPGSLNGEVWRVDVDQSNGPSVTLDHDYWERRYDFAPRSEFLALVVPTVLRSVLARALSDGYRELSDDDWQAQWLRFSLGQGGGPGELPGIEADEEEIEVWVNERVEAFARRTHVRQKFDAYLSNGGST